jgi:hypothetical protein
VNPGQKLVWAAVYAQVWFERVEFLRVHGGDAGDLQRFALEAASEASAATDSLGELVADDEARAASEHRLGSGKFGAYDDLITMNGPEVDPLFVEVAAALGCEATVSAIRAALKKITVSRPRRRVRRKR